MRLITTTALFAGLASYTLAHSGPSAGRRKTLGFGPVHPHAKFNTGAVFVSHGFEAAGANEDPLEAATRFVRGVLGEQLSASHGFVLRKDSYTDKATGVTHAYFRQLINGVEVSDGDMNVNVLDGNVISFGNSFYQGAVPDGFVSLPSTSAGPHAEFCEQLGEQHQAALASFVQSQGDQVALGAEHVDELSHAYASNCEHVETPFRMAQDASFAAPAGVFDPRAPLLQFMIAAAPQGDLVQDITANWDGHLDRMTSHFEPHFIGGETAVMTEIIANVPGTVNPVKAKPVYVQVADGDKTVLVNAWRYEVEMTDNWYEAVVSIEAPHRILSVVDWASDSPMPTQKSKTHSPATYNVFPWGVNDPSEGNRTIEKESFDSLASPLGWHVIPSANDPLDSTGSGKYTNFTTTAGNNVFAHENWEGANNWVTNYRPDAGSDLAFNYTYDPKLTDKSDALDEAKKYINTTVTQLFYTTNMVHDLYHRYGFDEVSGNFQQHNFGRGGAENDAVIANAQDGSGYNNANFMTPPDGQNGRCRMYLWNTALPYRDGDLEAGIVIHELSHGLSTRLTGGPANSGCLGFGEAGGMGEGWGDFLASTIRAKEIYEDFPMGAWAANTPKGIRNFPYSLNETVNPSKYNILDRYWGVHAIGEVWAEMLWVVSQKLIEKHGFSGTLFPPQPLEDGSIPTGDFYRPQNDKGSVVVGEKNAKPLVPIHGNTLSIQLVLDGMKLQPCRPGFFEARDAIIQADEVRTGGENVCDIWRAFAGRGLGQDATVVGRTPWGGGRRANGFSVPSDCKEDLPKPEPKPVPPPGDGDDGDDGEDDDWPWPWNLLRKFWWARAI